MKMKNLFSLILLAVLFTVGIVNKGIAQQYPQHHLYGQDYFMLNPAVAGSTDHFKVFLNSRQQYSGIDGAPKTVAFGMHNAYSDKVGLGLFIMDDQAGAFGRFTAHFNYAYKLKLSEAKNHYLSFGLGFGFVENSILFGNLIADDYSDEVLRNYQGFSLDARLGVDYRVKDFQLGVSIPTLFDNDVSLSHTGDDDFIYDMKRHYLGYTSYKFNIKKTSTEENGEVKKKDFFYLQPSVLYQFVPSDLSFLDLNLAVGSNQGYWIGFTYRPLNNSYAAAAGINVFNLGISYSYELPTTNLTSYSSSTHEVMLTYQFKSKAIEDLGLAKKIEELFGEMNGVKGKLNNQEAEQQKQNSDIEELKNRPAGTEGGVSQEQFDAMQKKLSDEIEALRNQLNKQAIEEGQAISKPTNVSQHVPLTKESRSELDQMRKDLDASKKNVMIADGDEIVKITPKNDGQRDYYEEETIPNGNYIIVYSFRELERAKIGVKMADNKGYKSHILFNKTRGWYYIYVDYNVNLKPALARMEEVRKEHYNDAWVHIYKAPVTE